MHFYATNDYNTDDDEEKGRFEAYAPFFGTIGEPWVYDAMNIFQDLLELIHHCINEDPAKKGPSDKCSGCIVHKTVQLNLVQKK